MKFNDFSHLNTLFAHDWKTNHLTVKLKITEYFLYTQYFRL